jgi:hypothetical protein
LKRLTGMERRMRTVAMGVRETRWWLMNWLSSRDMFSSTSNRLKYSVKAQKLTY